MSSSGTMVREFARDVECGTALEDGTECPFAGPVDAWYDPEISAAGWTCPECGTEHEIDADDLDDRDPDDERERMLEQDYL